MIIAIIGNGAQSLLLFRASLIRNLVERGHTVLAYAPDYTPGSMADVADLGARAIRYPLSRAGTNPISEARTTAALYRSLRHERPDVVLCYFIKPAIYGSIAAILARVPRRIVLLEGLGYGFAPERGASPRHRAVGLAMRSLLRLSLRGADQVIVLNAEDLAAVRGIGVPVARSRNMGGIGVELDRYEVPPVRAQSVSFALAARLIREKGVVEFVSAARRVKELHPEATFYILGDVDENPGSLQAAELSEWVDEQLIVWPGRVSDVQHWLRKCDVFVLPSFYREGVPRSIQEAMALGRAIITTDHVGCRDTVDHGINGFLVPPRDVEALTQAMLRFLEEPGLAKRMGTESRRLAEERFDARRADQILTSCIEGEGDVTPEARR
ncbi:glycosyltransferase family 4 protein [Sphingomonas sp. NPDC079357]|jgi:glycosyltransferase involved in cell wall biosynthesis|uniref:glycosyltransferase family 4 protein n=1 Tax=Sphingomonas sp. NPDC079357 TaxID=3364518 RepID=UPI0038515F9E